MKKSRWYISIPLTISILLVGCEENNQLEDAIKPVTETKPKENTQETKIIDLTLDVDSTLSELAPKKAIVEELPEVMKHTKSLDEQTFNMQAKSIVFHHAQAFVESEKTRSALLNSFVSEFQDRKTIQGVSDEVVKNIGTIMGAEMDSFTWDIKLDNIQTTKMDIEGFSGVHSVVVDIHYSSKESKVGVSETRMYYVKEFNKRVYMLGMSSMQQQKSKI